MNNKIRSSVRVKSLTSIYKVILSKQRTLDINSLEPDLLSHSLKLGFGPLLQFYGIHEGASGSAQSLILAADLSAKVLTGNQLEALEDIINAAAETMKDLPIRADDKTRGFFFVKGTARDLVAPGFFQGYARSDYIDDVDAANCSTQVRDFIGK